MTFCALQTCSNLYGLWINRAEEYITGKSLSEALFLGSTNPQHDQRLFIDLPVQYMKNSSEHGENIELGVAHCQFSGFSFTTFPVIYLVKKLCNSNFFVKSQNSLLNFCDLSFFSNLALIIDFFITLNPILS